MTKQIRIITTNRMQLQVLSLKSFEPNVAVISITDHEAPLVHFVNEPKYLLRTSFNDVGFDEFWDTNTTLEVSEKEAFEKKYHVISTMQAKEIATFYHEVINNDVDTIICQCEHGVSRSAAIKAAILEYEVRRGIDVFVNKGLSPSKTVFKRVLKALIAKRATHETIQLLELTEE